MKVGLEGRTIRAKMLNSNMATRFERYLMMECQGKKIPDDMKTIFADFTEEVEICLLYTSPSPRDRQKSRMPSSA